MGDGPMVTPLNELTRYHAVAEHVLNRIEQMGVTALPGLSISNQSVGNFNGDISLCAYTPSGGVRFLLADFTELGLHVAVTALPLAELFYSMTRKGFGLSDIIEEINKKLFFVLPDELYCNACLLELEEGNKLLTVWNGGMPDVQVYGALSELKHTVKFR